MPNRNRIPSHCKHRVSGRGVVRLDGRDFYTGSWGTKSAKAEYDRLVARRLSGELTGTANDMTVGELWAKYWTFVRRHYQKNGVPTQEQTCIRCAIQPVREHYKFELASEFGPKSLKAVRDRMIDGGQCRQAVNGNTGRVRRMFKWAVSEELVPVEVYQRLCTVTGLERGRTEVREADPVQPVVGGCKFDTSDLLVGMRVTCTPLRCAGRLPPSYTQLLAGVSSFTLTAAVRKSHLPLPVPRYLLGCP